ncbi:MAG: hypothetical protein KAJ01_07870, partial [Candidatus Hydrogenedentes bacterium]|nr:hypothetical protein [Candidatus Hydrogenedentota bacterium]
MTDGSTNNDPTARLITPSWGKSQEADVICSVLQSGGISAFILNENVTNLWSHMNIALNPSGVRIAVRQCDLSAAREV